MKKNFKRKQGKNIIERFKNKKTESKNALIKKVEKTFFEKIINKIKKFLHIQ